MEKCRKLNKFKVGIVIFLIVFVFSITVFGRYIYNNVRDAYLTARQFYFTSDILTTNGVTYTYNNWGGVDVYEIEFDLYSYNNKIEKLNYDLDYIVSCKPLSNEITCGIGTVSGGTLGEDGLTRTSTGTIYTSQNNTSTVKILVVPKEGASIEIGDTIELEVKAKTKEPYEKEISCKFSLSIMTQAANTYSIEDIANRDYAILKLVCANDTATQVTLEFNPSIVRLDLNDEIYLNNEGIEVDGNNYVKKITFYLEAESTKNVKFYKVDKTQNYTYPGVAETSVIAVTI